LDRWEHASEDLEQQVLLAAQSVRAPRQAALSRRRCCDWVGYDNSWVDLDGRRMQSVPGGSHWGGGVSINSLDQLRIGQLLLDHGRHERRQVVSTEWVRRMRTPCALAPFYGYLLWLNLERSVFPSAPASSVFAIGAGSSITWIDPERQMVVVVRWINPNHADAFFRAVGEAVNAST
jgi:CubicO group peptidase (beta-lactamase class C family)